MGLSVPDLHMWYIFYVFHRPETCNYLTGTVWSRLGSIGKDLGDIVGDSIDRTFRKDEVLYHVCRIAEDWSFHMRNSARPGRMLQRVLSEEH